MLFPPGRHRGETSLVAATSSHLIGTSLLPIGVRSKIIWGISLGRLEKLRSDLQFLETIPKVLRSIVPGAEQTDNKSEKGDTLGAMLDPSPRKVSQFLYLL